MANRNNPQNTNQQNRTRNRNRDYNRDYGRDYGNWREYDTYYYYTPDYDYDYDTDFYDYNASPDNFTYTEYWYVPGPFFGFGPQDWQRSDDSIREDVNERLTFHGHLDARNIHVDVHSGVVTLTGDVPSRREKRLAEDIADSVYGVTDVQNQLRIENKNQRQIGQGQGQVRSSANVQGGQVNPGMEVDSRDGKKIGTVKEIRNNTILVDRSMKQDIFIPFNAFSVQNSRVVLNVNSDQVDNQGWQTPESKAVDVHA